MKPIVKLGYLAAACALLVTAFAIIGPRTVHAIAATLVQVVNTPTSPVHSVQAPAASAIYQKDCNASVATSSVIQCSFPAVPKGSTLVVDSETINVQSSVDPPYETYITGMDGTTLAYITLTPQISGQFRSDNATVAARLYIPAGTTPACVSKFPPNLTDATIACTMTGYLVPSS